MFLVEGLLILSPLDSLTHQNYNIVSFSVTSSIFFLSEMFGYGKVRVRGRRYTMFVLDTQSTSLSLH